MRRNLRRQFVPKDGGPLYVRYDLDEIRWNTTRDSLLDAPKNMWRYAAVLPDAEPVTLGEGFTPMLPSRKYRQPAHQGRRSESHRLVQSARHELRRSPCCGITE